jgi:hypothetical protein
MKNGELLWFNAYITFTADLNIASYEYEDMANAKVVKIKTNWYNFYSDY